MKFFTKQVNKRYSLNQDKAEMFEESMILYGWLLSDPNADPNMYRKLLKYLDARYMYK